MFSAINLGALERYRVPVEWKGGLSDVEPREREAIPFSRPETEAATAADIAEIDRLQEMLYAQAKYALLVVLQGPDTSGKDGTIRRVFNPINPLGAVATSFKKPTPHELAHDFLWRIHNAVPAAGMIGIFNRSHYEDVLVPRVHALVPADRIEARYHQINAFEQHLVENDVVIIKFYLRRSRNLGSRLA
jgi:polyphosphate kinase 2 (PPK2 family)